MFWHRYNLVKNSFECAVKLLGPEESKDKELVRRTSGCVFSFGEGVGVSGSGNVRAFLGKVKSDCRYSCELLCTESPLSLFQQVLLLNFYHLEIYLDFNNNNKKRLLPPIAVVLNLSNAATLWYMLHVMVTPPKT